MRILLAALSLSLLLAAAQPISVRLNVTVTRGDTFITDLPQQAFTVLEDGKLQSIASFERQDGPVSVALVIDKSGSTHDTASSWGQLARVLVDGLHPQSEVSVISFHDLVYLDAGLTENRNEIAKVLSQGNTSGGSALRDACLLAVQYLAKNARYDMKVVVIFSDGRDNASKTKLDDWKLELVPNPVMVYALQIFDRHFTGAEQKSARNQLKALSEPTGGIVYESKKPAELEQAAERIAREIRSQYVLTYSPADQTLSGRLRKISVKVQPSDKQVRVRTRSGYYATP